MEPRDLSEHVEYAAGGGIEEVARELGRDPAGFTKLASNENAHGPSPAAVEAIRAAAGEVHRYPKAAHADLTDAVAGRHGVTPEQVWLSPGADGAIDYLSRATLDPGDEVLVPDPGFAYYGMSARYHHGAVHTYPVERERGLALDDAAVLGAYAGERLVYLTSPHNPTGARFALDDVAAIARATDDHTLTVVDEAYVEYADGPSAVELLGERDDVAVLRTFSKAFGLAGLRVGYAVVPGEWAGAYRRVNTPFAANEVACRAGLAALDDGEHVERAVETARWAREYIRAELDARTWESHANFVLAEVGDAAEVAEAARRQGLIVRDCTSFGLPDCIRVTTGTREETREAVETLNGVLG
ncbi:MAG: histidinol-phosphate transaminase [Halobacteriaceae archaeon]